ncbi:unnamed protein product [Darwinula stevensoni]|uniref:HTH cro/C1-type domain-containing protein n=1 Tax=Darwinula stevensoni TaxID=69355 RepID=A0A7R9AAM9_9CRUS|nr:unnamed protein product [Darwinula stevensoni]CAG0898452.1 unnamed protein product [Darwinula stevensoni]
MQALNAAQRQGVPVETTKKFNAGTNKHTGTTLNTTRLDRETEELKHDKVTLDVGRLIQQGRQAKNMTQKDLATRINEKPQVINDYEAGRAIPNQAIMGKIERILGKELPIALQLAESSFVAKKKEKQICLLGQRIECSSLFVTQEASEKKNICPWMSTGRLFPGSDLSYPLIISHVLLGSCWLFLQVTSLWCWHPFDYPLLSLQ